MATKVFQGEVIKSADGSFPDKKSSETIVGWELVVLLDDEHQKRFFVSERNVCYNEAKIIVPGNQVRVHANAEPGFGDAPKWTPVQIEKLIGAAHTPEELKKEPPF